MDELEALYTRYYRSVYLYTKSLTHDAHLAEDITADTFLKAISSIGSFRGECDLRIWLCQIAKNQYISYCRKHRREIPEPDPDFEQADPHRFEIDMENREDAERIQVYLHRMKEPYKEVFMLRVYGEMSFARIAELFGKRESWARVTYLRARRQLQKDMKEGLE